MLTCQRCSTPIPENSQFCLSCGSRVGAATTPTSAATEAIATPGISSSHPSDFDEGRFPPGTLLAERYRILGRLGRGGMGEVYRANDLRLGQTVALKFLPEMTAQDPAMLARFYNEVRIARQVTHPNVCRVYDIGEVNGQPFLSMQFVDGENLASLLLRIGRLPSDKAVEISRRLCAGLAAAHSQGVLHRDLKPANIMIDGRGQVLIADFGLSGLAGEIHGTDIKSGTPAYMSPEQLAGKEVTARSDIYSLGLVMYEMFTGQSAFQADTLAELMRLREESRPAEISSKARDVDPAVERIIQRCLDPDPAKRPASALAVSAALPGGDPLAAALAAGETPSPEMVAAAGAKEGIRPALAIGMLAACLLALGVVLFLHSRQMLLPKVNLDLPPDALAAQARKTIQQLGYTGPVADRVWGFDYNGSYIQYLRDHKPALDWTALANGQPSPIYFSYRESPRPLEPHEVIDLGRITQNDPPQAVSGMTYIALDPTGRMIRFTAVPPQVDTSPAPAQPPDPAPLFAAAGLDLKTFQPAAPQWTPLAAVDARAAWTGSYPGRPENPIRIEAAWWHDKPVYFQMIGPWTKPDRAPTNSSQSRTDYVWNILTIGGLIFAALMTWRNLRLGRGDRRGALRLAAFAFVVNLAIFLLRVHAGTFSWGYELFTESIGESLWVGAQFWLAYLALEPVVRRFWPTTLITWTRILSGQWRDALVGRDVLIGMLVGMAYDLIFAAANAYEIHRGAPPTTSTFLDTLLGLKQTAGIVLNRLEVGVIGSLLFFLLFFFLRAILRKEWLAGVVFTLFFVIGRGFTTSYPFTSIPATVIVYGVLVLMLLRCGLLALVVTIFITDLVPELAFTFNFSAWYGTGSLVLVLIVGALSIVAFRNALGNTRPLAGFLDQ
ncbi:MAG TPA: serine/threonine-protein kinase [Bryobacteraceae bacterium]|nr:serine/threonine-protein kinase [Bryobacteraceae bacterium]